MYWSNPPCKTSPDTTERDHRTCTCSQLLLKAAFEAATLASHECRNRLFHAIYCDLEVHSKTKGNLKPLHSFCIPNNFIDIIGPALDPQIQHILSLHNLHRKYKYASKLRKIFLIAMLASVDYIDFLGDMVKVVDNNNQGKLSLSDDNLPIEGSQVRGLDEKYAETFREFFWYQYLFLDGCCGGSCRFKQEEFMLGKTTSGGSGQKPDVPILFNEKDLDRRKKVVRSAALNLALLSRSDCRHCTKKVGFMWSWL